MAHGRHFFIRQKYLHHEFGLIPYIGIIDSKSLSTSEWAQNGGEWVMVEIWLRVFWCAIICLMSTNGMFFNPHLFAWTSTEGQSRNLACSLVGLAMPTFLIDIIRLVGWKGGYARDFTWEINLYFTFSLRLLPKNVINSRIGSRIFRPMQVRQYQFVQPNLPNTSLTNEGETYIPLCVR